MYKQNILCSFTTRKQLRKGKEKKDRSISDTRRWTSQNIQTYLHSCHLAKFIAPAGFRHRGRDPRRDPKFPRLRKYRLFRCINNMRNLLDLKKLGGQGGTG